MAARPCVLRASYRNRRGLCSVSSRDGERSLPPIKKPHPSVSFLVPQAASAFRGPPLRIAASPHHEPRCGAVASVLLSDAAGAHGGRQRFTGAPGSYPDRSKPRPPDLSSGETHRPHPHPQSNQCTSCSRPPHPVSLLLTAPFPPTLPRPSRPRLRRLATPLFPPTSEPRYAAGPVAWRARASEMLPIVRWGMSQKPRLKPRVAGF
jgi:hypothetical protein